MAPDLELTPLTPTIGAEVAGVDLSAGLNQETYARLRGALLQHQVLFFRDQDITLDQQKAFGKLFGPLHIHPQGLPGGLDDHPDVLTVHSDENTKRVAGYKWHSDVSCDAEPPMASILRLHTVPPNGGDTLFASMTAAYDALSAPMKRYLEGLTATHDGGPGYRNRAQLDGPEFERETYPKASHPVVRTHPETGAKALFVNSIFTQSIDGVPEAEGRAILDFLFRHAADPAFQCRFGWEVHSIAFWDNRCTQHIAMDDYFPQVRSGYRVTIQGGKPF